MSDDVVELELKLDVVEGMLERLGDMDITLVDVDEGKVNEKVKEVVEICVAESVRLSQRLWQLMEAKKR